MKDFLYKKLIIILILFQPVIDIITSFMIVNDIDISVGIISKVLIIFLSCIYLIFYDKENRKLNFCYLVFLGVIAVLNIFNNTDIINVKFFEYFNLLFKYIYHLVILLFFIRWYKNYDIKLYDLRVPIFLITISYFIAIISGTTFFSYGEEDLKIGFSGWYSSANELSNLLCLLFPIALYNAFHNKNGIFLDKVLFVLTGLCMLLVGTKAGLLGFYGVLIVYIVIRLVLVKKKKLDKYFYVTLFITLITTLLFTKLPVYNNIFINANQYDDFGVLLSGRDYYLQEALLKRENITLYDKFVGKVFIYDNFDKILLIEQDFLDIYFMFGLLGIVMVLTMYGIVYWSFIKKLIAYLQKPKIFSKKYFAIFIAVSLELCVAFIAGHSLLSPSVSTYLSLLLALSLNIEMKVEKKEKQRILIGTVHAEIGGIERALISLLERIDYRKYDVTLMILKPSGKLLEHIPSSVKITNPYQSLFLRRIVVSNNIFCKIIKHSLFNFYTGWLWSSNEKYDVAISYSGYYPFVDMYIANSKALKKLIWVHSDYLWSYNNEKVFKNRLDRTSFKYKYFDKIIAVSKSAMDNFNKLLPYYQNKTGYMYNLIEKKEITENDSIKLDGKYNIVSIGRFCRQKRFDRLVYIHKNLIDLGYDIKTYIIGKIIYFTRGEKRCFKYLKKS